MELAILLFAKIDVSDPKRGFSCVDSPAGYFNHAPSTSLGPSQKDVESIAGESLEVQKALDEPPQTVESVEKSVAWKK